MLGPFARLLKNAQENMQKHGMAPNLPMRYLLASNKKQTSSIPEGGQKPSEAEPYRPPIKWDDLMELQLEQMDRDMQDKIAKPIESYSLPDGSVKHTPKSTKTCPMCGLDKDIGEFFLKSGNKDGYCKPCRKKRNNQTYKLRKERIHATKGGLCDVCGLPFDSLVEDHNHETGEHRGYLCRTCNSMLGFAKDKPEVLRKGANYLELKGFSSF